MNLGLFGFQKCDKGFVGVSLALTPLTETGNTLSGSSLGFAGAPPGGSETSVAPRTAHHEASRSRQQGLPLCSPLHPSGFSE